MQAMMDDRDPRQRAVVLVEARQHANRQRGQGPATEEQMARALGVTQQAWNHVRLGRRRPGLRMMRGMMAVVPETRPLLAGYLVPGLAEMLAEQSEGSSDA